MIDTLAFIVKKNDIYIVSVDYFTDTFLAIHAEPILMYFLCKLAPNPLFYTCKLLQTRLTSTSNTLLSNNTKILMWYESNHFFVN